MENRKLFRNRTTGAELEGPEPLEDASGKPKNQAHQPEHKSTLKTADGVVYQIKKAVAPTTIAVPYTPAPFVPTVLCNMLPAASYGLDINTTISISTDFPIVPLCVVFAGSRASIGDYVAISFFYTMFTQLPATQQNYFPNGLRPLMSSLPYTSGACNNFTTNNSINWGQIPWSFTDFVDVKGGIPILFTSNYIQALDINTGGSSVITPAANIDHVSNSFLYLELVS
jgi:hypothetical protein